MQNQFIAEHLIGKIKDKFYIFTLQAMMGGVQFTPGSQPFHTEEEAHSVLIEQAKENSTDEVKISCIEITRSFIYVGDSIEKSIS
jgi:hypothetical protein